MKFQREKMTTVWDITKNVEGGGFGVKMFINTHVFEPNDSEKPFSVQSGLKIKVIVVAIK